jgi:hypothetical protein
MKKFYILGLVSAVSILSLTGCSQTSLQSQNNIIEKSISIHKPMGLKKIRNTIIKAGAKNAWLMTELEGNKIMAEKITDNTSYVTTIIYDKKSFYTKPDNSALNEIINNALNTK